MQEQEIVKEEKYVTPQDKQDKKIAIYLLMLCVVLFIIIFFYWLSVRVR